MHLCRQLLLILFLALVTTENSAMASNDPIYFTISLFWEGELPSQIQISALNRLRDRYPQINMHHFINASYLTNKSHKERLSKILRQQVRPGDQVGLLLSPRRELVEYSQVLLRHSPSFWGPQEGPCTRHCGSTVPMSSYSPDEIQAMIRSSHQLFKDAQLAIGRSFAVAGWQQSPLIHQEMRKLGYRYDWSAIPPSRIKRRLSAFPVYQWVKLSWQSFEKSPLPRKVNIAGKGLAIIPQTVGVIDYNTGSETLTFVQEVQEEHDSPLSIINIGVHIETLATQEHRLRRSLDEILLLAQKIDVPLTFDWPSYRNSFELE